MKSEFRQNLGRLGLFYGNKTQVPLTNFQPVLQWSGEGAQNLNVQIKAVDSTLDAGAQIQQMLTAECIDSFCGEILGGDGKNSSQKDLRQLRMILRIPK